MTNDARMPFQLLPMKGRGRRIVYLDQNVISWLGKVRLSRENGPNAELHRALCGALKDAVDNEKIRCVESIFHQWESSALLRPENDDDRKVFRAVNESITWLSFGLRLKMWTEMARCQTLATVADEKRIHTYSAEWLWRLGFERDPQESNRRAGVEWDGDLFVLSIPWRPMEIIGAGWAKMWEPLRKDHTFEQVLAKLQAGIRDAMQRDNHLSSWAYSWCTYDDAMKPEFVDAFIASNAFFALPVVDVLTRIEARVLSDPRPLKDSDPVDAKILALAIPYCDAILTDNYMATIATSTKLALDTKYNTRIFATKTDGLTDFIAWLKSL